MKDELSKQQTDAILKILDELVADGGWEASAFLRVLGKKLQSIRDELSTRIESSGADKSRSMSNLARRMTLRSGQQEVFIALYSSDGANLQSWERIIMNLPRQMISRPIYANEEDVMQAIRAKENKANEAYAAVYINQSDVLPMGDKTPVDRLGRALLTLKDKSLNLENMSRFVHASGIYYYSNGHLMQESAAGGNEGVESR